MANKKINCPKDQQIHDALQIAYDALKEKGYDAINQLTGFVCSTDLHYITPYNGARKTLEGLYGEDIIKYLLEYYFEG